jgi:hypothetical protein
LLLFSSESLAVSFPFWKWEENHILNLIFSGVLYGYETWFLTLEQGFSTCGPLKCFVWYTYIFCIIVSHSMMKISIWYQETCFVSVVIWQYLLLRATIQLNGRNIKSRIRMHLTGEHVEVCMWITIEIKFDIERLLKQMQCQIPHEWVNLLKKIIG